MKNQFDFCYVYDDGDVHTLRNFLFLESLTPEMCGLRKLEHFTNCFELFVDLSAKNGNPSRHLQGISTTGNLGVSLIPRGMVPIAMVHFNEEEYNNA